MSEQTIRVIIADDEELSRKALKNELAQLPGIEIIGECENGFFTVKEVMETRPDLLFLDIQMPRLDGFDVLELLGAEAPAVVFVTAFDEYAVRAFEARAVDYLLKPVRAERLKKAIAQVRRMTTGSGLNQSQQHLLDDHREKQIPIIRILVRTGTDVQVIPVAEISHFQAEDDYVRIHTQGRSWLKSERMNRLEQLLDPRLFCRIHRSFIINIQFLKAIEPYSKESRVVKLNSGEVLPVSREGYTRLKALL